MSKQSLVERAAKAVERFGAAADVVDDAAADAFGIIRTDLRIIGELVDAGGRMTAGQVAEATGLSPAATTAAVQRLVEHGYVVREPDPADRRRVTVTLTAAAEQRVESVYGPVAEDGTAELRRRTVAELEVIIDFLERGYALQLEQAARIRAMG
ncbi:MarR family winged helix-turn-helix transcriptional regulator [Promicromonospora sp. NPDC060271]|uniref:MarR family winged helix-turn-helix transcriptional regulator n=1 Tax=Promicromonospora sp. NPDC060271 TaxID=3347089 RepID=UPI00364DAD8F